MYLKKKMCIFQHILSKKNTRKRKGNKMGKQDFNFERHNARKKLKYLLTRNELTISSALLDIENDV